MNSAFLTSFVILLIPVASMKIVINHSASKGPLPKFWKSTGFSPPLFDQRNTRNFLMSKDVELNLAIISSLPRQGIEFVRVHWILNLLYFNADQSINWILLDNFIEQIVGNGMKPIFELMINPEASHQKIFKIGGRLFWKRFTAAIAQRYSDKYGSNSVSKWRFETWNEPDLKMYNTLDFDIKEYIDYVDGCSEGIKSVLPDADFGGPAGLFKNAGNHPLCWGFLHHCNKAPARCKLGYLSLHKKGNSTSSQILIEMNDFHAHLVEKFPNLSAIPLVNDETDLLSGWWREEEWRGDVRYAAAVCRTIHLYKSSFSSLNMKSISNDNGFLNTPPQFFNQRTLLTRFIDDDRKPYFVQKPIYAAMGLLALLGEEEVQTIHEEDERFSIIATRINHKTKKTMLSLNIIIIHSVDNIEMNDTESELEIVTYLPKWEDARYVLYKLENTLPNPKQIWEDFGQPSNPSRNQLSAMEKFQEPHRITYGNINEGQFKKIFNIVLPSISFLQICCKGVQKPAKVRKLKAHGISDIELLLTWKESIKQVRCIKTFVVEYCHDSPVRGCFQRINKYSLIFNSFYVHSYDINNETVSGFFRVAGIDFWGRRGHYSNILHFVHSNVDI